MAESATTTSSSWFRGIKGRLLAAATLPVVGFIILFGVSLRSLNKEDVVIRTAHESLVPNLDAIGTMRNARNRFSFQLVYTFLTYDVAAERIIHVKAAQTGIDEYEEAYKKYQAAPFLEGEEKMHEQAKDEIAEVIKLMKEMQSLIESGDPAKAKEAREIFDGKFKDVAAVTNTFVQDVNKMYRSVAVEQAKEAVSTRSEAIFLVVSVAVVISLLTFGSLIWLAQKISTSVGSVATRLTGAGLELATSVEQLSQAGNNLSSSATEAAASLEQTVASLEEIKSMVQKNTDSSKQAADLSLESRKVAERGQTAVGEMLVAMDGINTSNSNIIGHIETSNQELSEIVRIVTEIGEKTKVINDIVFQTKLLSFNASVEAARAGENGKGFAVVAEEIGNLASMSGRAAKEISEMLVTSENKVSAIVEGTKSKVAALADESKEKVNLGTQVATQCSEILGEINGNVGQLSEMANSISVASSEQYVGIQEISKAMNQLDQAGQANASAATEVAAAADGIRRLSLTAQGLTVELDVVVTGSQDAKPAYVGFDHTSPPSAKKFKSEHQERAA